jgi:hypothetical protein
VVLADAQNPLDLLDYLDFPGGIGMLQGNLGLGIAQCPALDAGAVNS